MRKQKKGFRARILLALVATAAALGSAELVVRAFGLAPAMRRVSFLWDNAESTPLVRSENPILGYRLKPDYTPPAREGEARMRRTNSHGQRDIERSLRKAPGVTRVILLGDSVVESIEIPNDRDVMHRRLEALYPNGEVEVLNFGINGYCTLAEVELLRVSGLRFDPDVVILVFVSGDFLNFNASVLEANTRHSLPSAWFRETFRHSHLFRFAAVQTGWLDYGMRNDPIKENTLAIGDNNVSRGLKLLRRLSDEHGFKAAVAVWPTFGAEEIGDPHPFPGSDDLIVERVARSYGIPSYRLSEDFRRHRERVHFLAADPCKAYTIGDGMHANVLGSRVGAAALKQVLDAVLTTPEQPVRPPGGMDEEALVLARQVGEASYNDEDICGALLREGSLRMREGHVNEAIAYFAASAGIDPDQAPAYVLWGIALSRLGKHDEAIVQYRKALRCDPANADAHVLIGIALHELGRDDKALPHFERALAIRPGYPLAEKNIARTLTALGRHEEAAEHARRAK